MNNTIYLILMSFLLILTLVALLCLYCICCYELNKSKNEILEHIEYKNSLKKEII